MQRFEKLDHLEDQADTERVVKQFVEAFVSRNAALLRDIVGDDCVMETMQPAPDGERTAGYEPNLRFWTSLIEDPAAVFEPEDTCICGDRAINRWRFRFGEAPDEYVRGVTLIRVRDGKIREALGYGKVRTLARA